MNTPSFAAEVLRPLMADKGWDQKTLALEIGVTETSVSQWLNQGQIPSDTHLDLIGEHVKNFDAGSWMVQRDLWQAVKRLQKKRRLTPDMIQENALLIFG